MKISLRKDSRGMSLVGMLAIIAVMSVFTMTIATLVDYMSRSASRLALLESISAAERSVLLCVQKSDPLNPVKDCGSCFFANAPPDNTPLSIAVEPVLPALVTQNIGSIRNNGLALVTTGAALPGENRVTVRSIQFVEKPAGTVGGVKTPARATSTIGGFAYTTFYGEIILSFDGPAGLVGGSSFSDRTIPVALSRRVATGVVDKCGLGSSAANFSCTLANATQPSCPSCPAPATLQSVVTNFKSDGQPECGCFCLPDSSTTYAGPPGAAGAAGPTGSGSAAIK